VADRTPGAARELRTEIEISAPAARVWEILTDFARFGEWNPFIQKIEGELAVGSRLEARLTPPGGRGMTFRPTVMKVDPGREFRWLGHLLFPGLFDGEHIFELESLGGGRTRLVQREEFRGVLAGLLLRSIAESTRRGFELMNHKLKERAEGRAEPRERPKG
jgi:hypothetical protein